MGGQESEEALWRDPVNAVPEAADSQSNRLQQEHHQVAQQRIAELEAYNQLLRGRDRLLEATAKATNVLLTLENFDEAVNTALHIIGEGAGCDRINVLESNFEASSDPVLTVPTYHTAIYEWDRPGIIRQMDHLAAGRIPSTGIEAFLEQYYLHGDGFGGLLEAWVEPLRSAYAAVQVKSSYSVPIRVKGQWWGVLCLNYCREAIEIGAAEVAVLRSIADCIGSAIQRDRTQKTTLQLEQTRVAELAKANNVLKQTVVLLATEPDLNRFLDYVLKALSEQFNAPLVQYWEHPEPGDIAYLRLACRSGQILTVADLPKDCLVKGVPIPPELNGYRNPQGRQRYVVVEDIPTDPIERAIFSPLNFDLETWCTEHQIRKLLKIALTWLEKPMSSLLLYFPVGHHLSEQEIELMCALAQQVTLAIQLKQLAEDTKQAVLLQERSRMAREIHDTLAQAFGGILMQLQAATYFATTQPEKAQTHLLTARALAQEGLAEARRSVWTLHLDTSKYEDLTQAIAQFIEQTPAGQATPIHLTIEGAPYSLHPDVGLNLLRIAQEAIANALRHAQATAVQVHLSYSTHALQLTIRDDGCGFDPQSPTHGFGLLGIQQRASHIGANWNLMSRPAEGTTLMITLTNSQNTESSKA